MIEMIIGNYTLRPIKSRREVELKFHQFYLILEFTFVEFSHTIFLEDTTTDYVFNRIFGYSGNEKITANLLHSILNEDIKNINNKI